MAALMAAMACVATMVIKIPIPATGGYINLGDCIVLLSGIILGPVYGGIAAGLGSALADLLAVMSPLHLPPLSSKVLWQWLQHFLSEIFHVKIF